MKKVSEIMEINWFDRVWNQYGRDDWIQVNNLSVKNVVFWDGTVKDFNNEFELIWYLALRWIINRLF
jgi:hypothetical protein